MLRFFQGTVFELILALTAMFLSIYFMPGESRISSDGFGYYDYLPSLFIHHDIVRKDDSINSAKYERINKQIGYSNYKDKKINKYHCGTAVLITPFFLVTHLLYPGEHTGYEWAFQITVLLSTLFYLLFALYFLKKLLLTYGIKQNVIRSLQIVLVFATGVLYYSTIEAAFSHVYSLFAITLFMYGVRKYAIDKQRKHLIVAISLLALIFTLRPINVLILLFVPFLTGSWKEFAAIIQSGFKDIRGLIIGASLAAALIGVQCLAWYAQTGEFFVYSYQNEGFNFSSPHFGDILFSFRKGLFIYAPVLFLGLIGLWFFISKRERFVFGSWLAPMIILIYVLSSWHDWGYGHSYGQRPFIEFYPLFFIPMALFLNEGKWKQITLAGLFVLCIVLNLVQTWQYCKFILHWRDMDFEKYKKVFLRTDERYFGMLWKDEFIPSDFPLIGTIDTSLTNNEWYRIDTLYSGAIGSISSNGLNLVHISTDNSFDFENSALIEVNVYDSSGSGLLYTRGVPIIHYADDDFGVYQNGQYWYDLKEIGKNTSNRVLIRVFNDQMATELKNLRIQFFSYPN